MRRILMAAFLVLSLFAVTALSVAAKSDNAAQVMNEQGCYSYAGITSCYTDHWLYKDTATPSGNQHWMENEHYCYTDTDASGAIVDQGCDNYHDHELYNATNGTDNYMWSDRYVYTYNGMTCVDHRIYHEVNGQLVKDSDTYSCS